MAVANGCLASPVRLGQPSWRHGDALGVEVLWGCRGNHDYRGNSRNRKGYYRPLRVSRNVTVCVAVANGDLKVSEDSNRAGMVAEELDRWLHNSVTEIVKNIGKAPFLVHVYKDNNEHGSSPSTSPPSTGTKLVIEKTTPEIWPLIKQRWDCNLCTMPNGIILVEELDMNQDNTTYQQEHQDKTYNLEESISIVNSDSYCGNDMKLMDSSNSSTTKMWGVVVQGRGVNYNYPCCCYLLKTCQVQCCFGISTHFSLAKVDDCFGKSVDFHLSKMWLQR